MTILGRRRPRSIALHARAAALVLTGALVAGRAGAQVASEYVDISTMPGVRVDLRYATTNNFMGVNVYGDFKTALLHRSAAEKLAKAAQLLQQRHPGWNLLVFDALRPRSVQRRFWEKVKGTPMQMYVADPDDGSIHNYGFAVDLSLVDAAGKEVDMGTPFDSFDPLAQPQLEDKYIQDGKLTAQQAANRHILRDAMEGAGFIQLPIEWWHYDAITRAEAKAQYQIVETFPPPGMP
jgi:zinc D-Ala-D-Ala dipeptidase